MKKNILMMALAVFTAASAGAQTIYDAANIVNKDLNGTARFVGMGGAMGALGGDVTTMGVNPAGIGIYRSNDAAISFGLSSFGTESNYQGNKASTDKIRGEFGNAGFVISNKVGNVTALRYVNFGFNYQRVKSFYKNMQMEGNLGDFSQTLYMAGQANGIESWGSDVYRDYNIGWLSAMGYKGHLITDVVSQSVLNDQLAANPNLKYDPYIKNGVQVENVDGKPMYRMQGNYVGMYTGGYGTFRSEERGGIDQFDFNVAFNFNDRFYLGMTIGAYALDYSKYSFYDEDYDNGERYNLQTWNKISGAGFDVKLGMIARPFEYSPLRIGFALHTPVFYSLDFKTNARLESDVWNNLNVENEVGTPTNTIGRYVEDTYDILNGDMVSKFQLSTPWTYNVSLGYTVGNSLALGAEYEYKDYSSVQFRDDAGYTDSFAYENSTTNMMKGVSTFRVGAEYKVIPQFALRAGYNFSSSLFKEDAYKDLPLNSIQTDTDFANTESLSNYTLGIGYRGSMFYADLAYKYTSYGAKFYPFDTFDGTALAQATKVSNTRSQVILTLGLRF